MSCFCVSGDAVEEALPVPKDASVSVLVDSLPLGRFHALHLCRQVLLNAVFAVTLESVPYSFSGMEAEFHIERVYLASYVSAFGFGCILGAVLVAIQDQVGRRPVIRFGAFSATLFSALIALSTSYPLELLLRVLQGLSFAFMQYGFAAWYAEFLPINSRGPLYVALTAGWPLGRSLAIGMAWGLNGSHWRWLQALPAGLMVLVCLISLTIPESPRFLSISGNLAGAHTILRRVYAFNRTPFPVPNAEALLHQHRASMTERKHDALAEWKARLLRLWRRQPRVLYFAMVLFAGVSMQQSLMLNWGPRIFQRLLYPLDNRHSAATLPYPVPRPPPHRKPPRPHPSPAAMNVTRLHHLTFAPPPT